jgi:hypothetical protein
VHGDGECAQLHGVEDGVVRLIAGDGQGGLQASPWQRFKTLFFASRQSQMLHGIQLSLTKLYT